MNVATSSKDIEILKFRYIKDYYKYLCKLTPELWCLLVYGPDDETLIYENIYFSYNDALYNYNHFTKEGIE